MHKPSIALLVPFLLALGCGSTGKLDARAMDTAPSTSRTAPMTSPLKFAGYAVARVKSGNYGGSTQFEVFPSEYSYSHYDAKAPENEAKQTEFEGLITTYIGSITVNGTIKLADYLDLLYRKDTAALEAVHAKYDLRRPVGSSDQPKPTLFFVDDADATVLTIDPYRTELSWNETTTALSQFLGAHAKHYKSTTQDAFYQKYYGK